MKKNIQAIILAAGKSTRLNNDKSKLAETICGQPMILYPTKLLEKMNIPTTVVVGYLKSVIKKIITQEHGDAIQFVVQEKQKGTGHALACTQEVWKKDNILVLNGDAPLLTEETVALLLQKHQESGAAISFVTSCNPDPTSKSYGRVVRNDNAIKIVEAKDFTDDATKYCCINAGIYLIAKDFLTECISSLKDNNANHEFYITDLVLIASEKNLPVVTIKAPFDQIRGVNTYQELWAAEQIKRSELMKHWMDNGVRFSVAQSTHVDLKVTIGAGSIIGCGVQILGKTTIGKNCTIAEFCVLQNAVVEDNAIINTHSIVTNAVVATGTHIGPFAHLTDNNITTPTDRQHATNSSFTAARLAFTNTSTANDQ